MTFRLTIRTGNDAMQTWYDLANALRRIAEQLQDLGDETVSSDSSVVMDSNGNRVGQWEVK